MPKTQRSAPPHVRGPAPLPTSSAASASELLPAPPTPEGSDSASPRPVRTLAPAVASDDALVRRAKAGDREAVGVLTQRYRGRALAFARGMVQQQAEDAVQEADLAVLRSIEQVRGSFKAWYFGVIRYKCLGLVRGRRPTTALYNADGFPLDLPVEDTSFWVKEKLVAVAGAAAALSDLELQALLMYEIDDLSFREIARILGCASESAAKDAAFRARRKIAKRMTEEGW